MNFPGYEPNWSNPTMGTADLLQAVIEECNNVPQELIDNLIRGTHRQ